MHLVVGELLEVFVKAFQACVGLLHFIMHPGSLLSFLLPLTLQLQGTDALYKCETCNTTATLPAVTTNQKLHTNR